MATGDTTDVLLRQKATLPSRWFASASPVLDAALSGPASVHAWAYALLAYVRLQTRIATATDFSLDIVAYDLFGLGLVRRPAETDANLGRRIKKALLRPRGSRGALISALTDLTGTPPVLFEPSNPHDTGAYGAGPGTPIGSLATGVVASPVSTAITPPYSGTTVYAPTAPLTGDSNLGYVGTQPAPIGATLTGQASVYIPAAYTGGAPSANFEGGVISQGVTASLAIRNTWQLLTVTSSPLTVAGASAFVLRATGAGANNQLYSSGWSWTRSSDVRPAGLGLGWNGGGGYGSLKLPAQLFVVAYRPGGSGIPNVSGWNSSGGGYGVGSIEYGNASMIISTASDAEILAEIARTVASGVTAWTRFGTTPFRIGLSRLGGSDTL